MNNLFIGIGTFFIVSFYSLQFLDINGNTIHMSNFQGKKVLIANIATGSNKVNQLAGLQQLQQQYGDSLVVIVFPSNSFGHEIKTNEEIKDFCETNYHSSFIIGAKCIVKGNGVTPLFNWLAEFTENGSLDGEVANDFQKFLIDGNGKFVAVMSPKLLPTDSTMITAITRSYQ
jgi:glutathione peroxidase